MKACIAAIFSVYWLLPQAKSYKSLEAANKPIARAYQLVIGLNGRFFSESPNSIFYENNRH